VRDQASALRAAAVPLVEPGQAAGGREGAIVIGSGKGGVGKSTLSVLLAAAMARMGRRTLLLDGSQNQGNLHILLGVRPAGTLGSILAGEATPADLVVPVAERLSLLPADSGAEALYSLGAIDRARLHHRLSAVYDSFDSVIVDGGPGLESVVRAAGIRASRLVVLAVPEPASLADAYALLKICHLQIPAVPLEVMVNLVNADEEGRAVFDRLSLAADRFLRRGLGFLGSIRENEALRRDARRPGALLSLASPEVDSIAARLAAAPAGRDRAAQMHSREG